MGRQQLIQAGQRGQRGAVGAASLQTKAGARAAAELPLLLPRRRCHCFGGCGCCCGLRILIPAVLAANRWQWACIWWRHVVVGPPTGKASCCTSADLRAAAPNKTAAAAGCQRTLWGAQHASLVVLLVLLVLAVAAIQGRTCHPAHRARPWRGGAAAVTLHAGLSSRAWPAAAVRPARGGASAAVLQLTRVLGAVSDGGKQHHAGRHALLLPRPQVLHMCAAAVLRA